jgi:hypothetical protein
MTELLLGALLTVAAVFFVAAPFLRAHEPPAAFEPADDALAVEDLAGERREDEQNREQPSA